ncbi:MAG: hypothetical protein N2115_02705 [bacterium]|nr:hypothetical protein [bacterium]
MSIEPEETSDTIHDIVVELEFTPTDPPGEPVYSYEFLTVYDVEIVNGDASYSETPVETEFFIGETKIYRAKVKPADFVCDICEWIYPWWGEWIIFEVEGEYCYVTGLLPDYGVILEVHVWSYDSGSEPAVDGVTFGIYSTNIQINNKEEPQEESTGIYIKRGQIVPIKIGPSMLEIGSPEFVGMQGPGEIHLKLEAIAGAEKVSLWEYEQTTNTFTQKDFPYTYSCSPSQQTPFESKTMYLKGEETSVTIKDIILRLKGYKLNQQDSTAIDTVVITVFDIDIILAGMDEETEQETGLYIPLNNDDDSDTVIDREDGIIEGGDDDVKDLIIFCEPVDLLGFLTLSWGSNIRLWESTSKQTQITGTDYSPAGSPPITIYVEGYNVSNSIRDTSITLSYTTPDETYHEDTAKITVYRVELSTSKDIVCAGGKDAEICKAEITGTTKPPIVGIQIEFEIVGNKGYDGIEDKTYYDIETADSGRFSSGRTYDSGITNAEGKAIVTYISGQDASNPETQLYFYPIIKASSGGAGCDTIEIRIDPPEISLEIFLDPETQESVEYIIADGESQVMNRKPFSPQSWQILKGQILRTMVQ